MLHPAQQHSGSLHKRFHSRIPPPADTRAASYRTEGRAFESLRTRFALEERTQRITRRMRVDVWPDPACAVARRTVRALQLYDAETEVANGDDEGVRSGFELRWAQTAEEVAQALGVREQVFCREQGVPSAEEHDGLDDRALHLLALDRGGCVLGTLRLLPWGGVARIGRVAVERRWRGRGIASDMLQAALEAARQRGCHEARLASQLAATGLYERAGFLVVSAEFWEAGIPHVWMRLALAPGPAGARSGP
jgi:predicted GNAT family N-acyltransferase